MKVLILWLLQATHDVAATNSDVEGLKVPKCHTPSQTHANVFLRTSPSPTIVTTALIIDAGVCQQSLACTTARAISSHDQGASSPTSFFSITHHGFTSFNTLDSCFLLSTLQPESSVTCVYFHFILCPLPLPPSLQHQRETDVRISHLQASLNACIQSQAIFSRNIRAWTKTLYSTPNPFMH